MIKRRFYKLDHGDRDAPSESSSSSDSELEAEATAETESEEEEEERGDNDDRIAEVRGGQAVSSSSGYESEDSSANELNLDSSVGLPTSEDDGGSRNDGENILESHPSGDGNLEHHNSVPEVSDIPSDFADRVVKCKSVFKCKLCPRIVCLTEDSLKAHLKSKRHARSEKLLSEGRLKLMLDDDGKANGEVDPENNSSAQISPKTPGRAKRRHIHSKNFKKKKGKGSSLDHARQSAKNPAKKRFRDGK
ncbi:uncharacterized protein [Coffea arabica]|uniref:Uncharacterized protein LOC113697872 isoform X1 n=1 Tax=Coffea arabica TaxID=13443 RepID=A0A6P6T5L4_COFAR|nr:uncharacterized protein LOC113697872 isoform X1 [Coffea arabica]XP_027073267.1 uncharacterized protein LOC113697872 isoform X1 [Coffea arabica]